MFGFFEWISDEMIPPRDAYDPAVGRPRCKKCGKDAWLMWNGKYSAYCSTECQNSDKRKGLQRSSVNSLLPSRGSRKGAKANAFERAVAAKKAARDIKAIAEKWTAQRKKEVMEDIRTVDAQQGDFESSGEDVLKGESFAQRQAEEAEFYKKQARLAQVAEALAKEHLRAQEETSLPSFKAPGTIVRPSDANASCVNSPSFWSSEAAALEQAFADELKRQAEDEEGQRTREISGKALARTRNVVSSTQAPLCDFSSSSRYKDTAVQTHLQTPEESARDGDNTRKSHKCERDTAKGKVSMGSKHRRDEKDYEGNCHKTTREATTSTVPRAEYAHPIGILEQSTTANDKTTTFGRRHTRGSKRWRDCTTRELGKTGRGKPTGDFVYARKQPPNEEDRLTISLDHEENGTRLRQQRRDSPCLYLPPHVPPPPEPELLGSVQNESPCAITTKLDVHCPTKSTQPAKEHSSILPHIPHGDVISPASHQDTLEAFRVAGTSDTYVTLDDMQQLREAAWTETKTAMEEACACCVHGEYAGNFEVHVLSAENVNPARVSPDDRLYVVVRCQVAEKEWAEKKSKSVRSLRWDELFSFPLMYEKYPSRARVCVQLWKRAPHQGDVDLFVGEGEIPFPLSVTRCVLPVQLCWNTKLGGSVVDLDCGRLLVAVRRRQRMHAGDANLTLTQTDAVSSNGKRTLHEREQSTTLLQARTALKGTQKSTERRRKVCNSDFVKTGSRKPAKYKAIRKNAGDYKSHLSTERRAGKTAQGVADIRWRPASIRIKSSQANPHEISETNALVSTIIGAIKDDENTGGQADKQGSVAVEVHKASSGSRSVPEANTAAVTGERSEYSDAEKDGHSLREGVRVSEDTEAVEQGEKQDLIARAAPTSAKALPLRKSTKSDSEISPETTVTKRTSKFLENLPYSSAAAPASTVSSDVCGVEVHEYVSNTIISFAGKRDTISNSRPSFHRPYLDSTCLPSVVLHNGLTKAELQVLLPVTLAQMDDFAHLDAEPGCVAPAANLDPCVLIQPWCTGRKKRTHCANRSCRRVISNRFMNDLFEEEEFRAWGCCSTCQGEMFHTVVSSSTDGSIRVSADRGMYDEFRLESFIPLAFPTLSVIWPSSRHLYVAQRFTHVQIQDRLRQCRTQRELTLTLMAPLLKYFVRSDWSTYRRIALRTCVRLKIQQHPRLQLLLAGTGRALLYDPTLPDFWEWGTEDEAVRTNLVGTLLMELRKEYS